MRPPGSPEALERRRLHAIHLLETGLPPVEVARRVRVARRSVRRWHAAYRRHGGIALRAHPTPGRPPKLDARARRQLVRALLKGAKACGCATDLWTCPRVAHSMRQRFGVTYHVDHLGRLLRSLGWSPQRPQRIARKRDEAAIQRWQQQTWPRINKSGAPARLVNLL